MGGLGSTIRWPAEAIWEAIEPALPGFTVEVLPELDSTNSELMRRAHAGQLEPVLLVAERQTAGRGRAGRQWHSAPDSSADSHGAQPVHSMAGLTFSLGLPLAPVDWSGLSLAVGLAVAQSLHPELRLKWPNDIWFNDRKLAGVLIETVNVGVCRYAVIGVGINMLARDAAGLRTPPAALAELLPLLDAPAVLHRVVPALVDAVMRFALEGFAPVQQRFNELDVLAAREVVCSDGVIGIAQGVDAGGALLVHTATGLKKISSAEVSVRLDGAPAKALP